MSITTANILLALKIVSDLSTNAAKIADMVHRAQQEGRDVTPEEVNSIKEKAKSSIDKIKEHLAEKGVQQ